MLMLYSDYSDNYEDFWRNMGNAENVLKLLNLMQTMNISIQKHAHIIKCMHVEKKINKSLRNYYSLPVKVSEI